MYKCPICGETANRKGESFDRVDKVLAHIDGSHDGLHADESGADYVGSVDSASTNPETRTRKGVASIQRDSHGNEADPAMDDRPEYGRSQNQATELAQEGKQGVVISPFGQPDISGTDPGANWSGSSPPASGGEDKSVDWTGIALLGTIAIVLVVVQASNSTRIVRSSHDRMDNRGTTSRRFS